MFPASVPEGTVVLNPPVGARTALSDENALVTRAGNNDAGAISELYELYFDRIYRYIAVRLNDPHEAEDVTQEVFLKVLRAVGGYRQTGAPFSCWLYRIAKNQVIDHARHAARHKSSVLDYEILSPYSSDNPQAMLDIESDMAQLREALKELTPIQREVIILRFTGGLSLAEVARITGKNEGSVKTLQHRAILSLRKRVGG